MKKFEFKKRNKKALEQSIVDDVVVVANNTAEVFKCLDKKYENNKKFNTKVVELLKRYKIGSAVDIAYLEGYLAAR